MVQHWFKTLFAATGTKTAVPDAADPSGFISYDTGYGPDYQRVLGTDPLAKTIERDKLNQVLYDMTGAIQQYQTHAFPEFITTADNGGTPYAYDADAIVRYDSGGGFNLYQNTTAANTNIPTGAGWVLKSGGFAPLASPALTGNVSINGVNVGVYPYRNRLINGANNVSQVNVDAAVIVTAGAALQYVIDQWYSYCTGANVTGQRIAGSLQSKYRYRYTGAVGVTKLAHAQRMEAINTYDMNGQSTMVGVDMSNSLLTTVTWTAWYANTTDTFGSLATPTRTQIATGTITVSPTLERHFIPISIPSAATTGIEIEFSVGAQISGTWVIGNAQFEKVPTGATQGTEYEWLSYEKEERRCQRYYYVDTLAYFLNSYGSTTQTAGSAVNVNFKVPMRTTPTIIYGASSNCTPNAPVGNNKGFYQTASATSTNSPASIAGYSASAQL